MLRLSLGQRHVPLTLTGHAVPDAIRRPLGPIRVWRTDTTAGPRYVLDLVLLVAAYYGAAHLGYALAFTGPVASILWLPVGVGAAFLYLRGPALWPGVVIGDLLVNNYSELPTGSAIVQSFGNLLEVVVCAVLLRRVAARHGP